MPTTSSPRYDFASWYDRDGRAITPNAYQSWVWRACQHPTATDIHNTGGFGAAKTTTGVNVLAKAMAINRQAGPGARYGLVSSDGAQLRHVTMAGLEGVINGATGWAGPFRKNPAIASFNWMAKRLTTIWGDELVWATGHDGAKSLEGGEFACILTDEATLYLPEAQRRIRERLRQTGYPVRFVLNTYTPQPGRSLSWLHERCRGLVDGVPSHAGVLRLAMPTRANAANLPPDYIDSLREMYSPQMARAMLEGEFVLLSGLVYPDMGEANVIDYDPDGDRELPLTVGWDPGYRRPFLALVQEFDPSLWVAFSELALADMSTEQQAHELARHPAVKGRSHLTLIMDPAGKAVQSTTGTSDYLTMSNTLRDYGIACTLKTAEHPEDRIITVGCERLRAWMCSAMGVRRFFVARHLQGARHRRGHDNQPVVGIWQALTEQPLKDGSDEPDRSVRWDAWSHPCDVARYLAVNLAGFKRVDREGWRSSRAPADRETPEPQPTARRGRRPSPAAAVERDM